MNASAMPKADQLEACVPQLNNALKLTPKDREVFVQALLHPRKPNARLRQAIQRYKRTFR